MRLSTITLGLFLPLAAGVRWAIVRGSGAVRGGRSGYELSGAGEIGCGAPPARPSGLTPRTS